MATNAHMSRRSRIICRLGNENTLLWAKSKLRDERMMYLDAMKQKVIASHFMHLMACEALLGLSASSDEVRFYATGEPPSSANRERHGSPPWSRGETRRDGL